MSDGIEPAEAVEEMGHGLDGEREAAERETESRIDGADAHGKGRVGDAARDEHPGTLGGRNEQQGDEHHEKPVAVHGEVHETEHDKVGQQHEESVVDGIREEFANESLDGIVATFPHQVAESTFLTFTADEINRMELGDEGYDGRDESGHKIDTVVGPGVANGMGVEFDGHDESHDLLLVVAFFAEYFTLDGTRCQHAHGSQLFVAEGACEEVGVVGVEAEVGGVELEELVVGVGGYFVEGEDFAALHGFAGLGMVVVDGMDMNTLGGVEFVAETAREVAVVHVNHSYRHPLWQPFLHHGGEEEEGEDYAEGEDDEVAGIELDAPQFAEHHSNSGVDVFVLHGAEGVERRELLFGVADDGRHAGTEAVDFFLRDGFDIETLDIVLSVGFGGTPGGVTGHGLHFTHIAGVGLLAEGGDVDLDGGAAVDVLEKVFAHGEGHPGVAHVEDGDHRRAGADEVAHFGVDFDNLAVARGDEVAVVFVALDFGDGTSGLVDECRGGIDVLTLGTFLGHEVLLFGGCAVGLRHLVFGVDFIEFLC